MRLDHENRLDGPLFSGGGEVEVGGEGRLRPMGLDGKGGGAMCHQENEGASGGWMCVIGRSEDGSRLGLAQARCSSARLLRL